MGHVSRIMFAAPKSGSGKTMFTCGFLQACLQRRLRCRSYKCGPDYIDPMFHQYVLGVPGGNLDTFFERGDALPARLLKHSDADITVIEGVMGYYDGLGGISTQASSYEIAAAVNAPVILVLDGKGGSLSLAAELWGFLNFREDSRIAGVVLNRTSPRMGELLKPEFERMGVRFLGCVPECSEAHLESRHLGLMMPGEQQNWRERLQKLADILEEHVDIDGILQMAHMAQPLEPMPETEKIKRLDRPYRMGVAQDEAFCFYYQENLELLKKMGAELVFFSPLHDKSLPKDCTGILLGGGYPELYAGELSANETMREKIVSFAQQGGQILAECGGFLYLHRTLAAAPGETYPMAGLVEGDGFPTGKLRHFGYVELEHCGVTWIKGHEFHYWDSTAPGKDCVARKPVGNRCWECMYCSASMIAGFPHLYYPSNPDALYRWLMNAGKEVGA